MKILLINPPIREWSQPNMFPQGLGYIAASLKNAGYEIGVLDINAYRWSQAQVEEKIKDAKFDIVGTGSLITTYKYLKWLANVLKKHHPTKPLIMGGKVVSSMQEQIMGFIPQVDVVVYGEGEITVVELVDCFDRGGKLADVRGICYRDNGNTIKNVSRPVIENIDTLPWPAWDLFPMEIYLKNPDGYYELKSDAKWTDGKPEEDTPLTINISASRGCPFSCIFCCKDFKGMKYRTMSPDRILQIIKYLQDTYGVSYFNIQDDLFICNRKHTHEFADAILVKGIKFEWSCSARVDLVDEELFKKIQASGCKLLGYGIESGSQRMLDTMKKHVKVEDIVNAVRLTQKHFEFVDASFVIGFPGENEETIQETIDLCKELNLQPEVVFFATPYPGTELWELSLMLGKIKDIDEYFMGLGEQGAKIRVNFTKWTDSELMDVNRRMIKELSAMNKKLVSNDAYYS